MAGIETLKDQSKLLDGFAELITAAKADDGKVSLSDLLSKEVWKESGELVELGKELVDDFDQLKTEVADLSATESCELIMHYLESFDKLKKAFA